MSTFADKLGALSKEAKAAPDPPTPTLEEIEWLVCTVKLDAQKCAKGYSDRHVNLVLDRILRSTIRPGPVPMLEEMLKAQGFRVRYSANMDCGFCCMRQCPENEHFGYFVSW